MWKIVFGRVLLGAFFILCCCAGCGRSSLRPRTTPYLIACPRMWEGIQLYGSEQNVVGFSADIIYEIAEKVGVQVCLVMADPTTFPNLLENGIVDAVITTESSTPVNDQFYKFSIPYFVGGTVVVVAANSPFKTTEDLKIVEIAYDRRDGLELALGVKTSWIFKPYDSTTQAMYDVIIGKVDGMILRVIKASQFSKSLYRSSIRILMPLLVKQNVRLAVRRGKNHELIELFNNGIKAYVKSGEYSNLLEYWGIDSHML